MDYTEIICRYSLLPALSQDGIIYSDIKLGAYDGEGFLQFLSGHLEVMNPYPAPCSVLVMDNCAIHHVPGVQQMCNERLAQIRPYIRFT